MTYSFTVRACSKASARRLVAAKFDEVVALQPIHTRDIAAILASANATIDTLEDDPTHDVSVWCSGYVSTEGAGARHVSIGCRAGLVKRTEP